MIQKVLFRIRNDLLKKSIVSHEREFNHIKYCLYEDNNSSTLEIVFSGFPGRGAAKYNYIRTLSKQKGNKLFILDDVWNPVNIGSYYLGENGDWYYIRDITDLVKKIVDEKEINNIITVGSSKGGSAALFYGVMFEANACIIGAPQYYVGNYLSSEEHLPILNAIMGNSSQTSIDLLNEYIKKEIQKKHSHKPEIFIHYSPKEHTYNEHIIDMVADLRENSFTVHEDNQYNYVNHSDVAAFFPEYLVKTIKNLI